MKDKRYLVTGAASGMGAAMTDLLAKRGASVVAVDRDATKLDDLGSRLGTVVEPVELDLADPSAIASALDGLELDGVANVAGIGPDSDDVTLSFQVNLQAPLRVVDAVRGGLKPGAAIVTVASLVGGLTDERFDAILDDALADDFLDRIREVIVDGPLAYTYAKRGVIREMTRLAVELAPDVRVNLVSPGVVDTPLGSRAMQLPWTQKLADRTPLGRVADPREIATTLAFLLSDDAGFITGADLIVDGGYSAYVQRRAIERAAAAR